MRRSKEYSAYVCYLQQSAVKWSFSRLNTTAKIAFKIHHDWFRKSEIRIRPQFCRMQHLTSFKVPFHRIGNILKLTVLFKREVRTAFKNGLWWHFCLFLIFFRQHVTYIGTVLAFQTILLELGSGRADFGKIPLWWSLENSLVRLNPYVCYGPILSWSDSERA